MNSARKLDPRSKLVLVICLSALAVIVSHWLLLSGVLLTSLLLLMIFGINPLSLLKKIRMLLYILVFIAIMQSVFTPGGQALISLGGIQLLTVSGLMAAGEFILRMLIIITAAGILSTSNNREIMQGLVQWKLPYEIAFMTAMGLRFLPVFTEEFKDALVAIQLRGVNFKSLPLGQKIEVIASLFQPVVAGALIKAKAISMSVEMRGFRASPYRTSYLVLKCRPKDYAVMIGSGLLTAAIVVCYFSIG